MEDTKNPGLPVQNKKPLIKLMKDIPDGTTIHQIPALNEHALVVYAMVNGIAIEEASRQIQREQEYDQKFNTVSGIDVRPLMRASRGTLGLVETVQKIEKAPFVLLKGSQKVRDIGDEEGILSTPVLFDNGISLGAGYEVAKSYSDSGYRLETGTIDCYTQHRKENSFDTRRNLVDTLVAFTLFDTASNVSRETYSSFEGTFSDLLGLREKITMYDVEKELNNLKKAKGLHTTFPSDPFSTPRYHLGLETEEVRRIVTDTIINAPNLIAQMVDAGKGNYFIDDSTKGKNELRGSITEVRPLVAYAAISSLQMSYYFKSFFDMFAHDVTAHRVLETCYQRHDASIVEGYQLSGLSGNAHITLSAFLMQPSQGWHGWNLEIGLDSKLKEPFSIHDASLDINHADHSHDYNLNRRGDGDLRKLIDVMAQTVGGPYSTRKMYITPIG